MTRADRVLIVVVLTASVCLALTAVPGLGQTGDAVLVSTPTGEVTIDLSSDAEYRVEGESGTLIVSVDDGQVRVAESPCPTQRCVMTPAIDSRAGAILCLPSGVTITPVDQGDVDCVVR